MTEKGDTRTISIRDTFGNRQVTKAQFIQQWGYHARQLKGLSWYELPYFQSVVAKVESIAADRFESLYNTEHSDD